MPPQPQFSLPTPKYSIFQGLVATIGPAESCQLAIAIEGKVLDPISHFLRRSTADVARDIGLGTHQFTEVEKLMGPEGIGLDHLSPVDVDLPRPLGARADAVAPVVIVGKAAARPAEIGAIQILQRRDHVIADSPRIGDRRVFPHPQAVIDAAAQMLHEVAIDMPAYRSLGLVAMDRGRGPERFGRSVRIEGHQQSQ